jgi:hypothetical protein
MGGATHHLVNIDQSPSYAEIGRAMSAAGVRAQPASHASFRAALLASSRNRLWPLAAFFPETGFAMRMGPWPAQRTLQSLADLGVEAPHIDAAIIAHYLAALGFRVGDSSAT